MKTTALVQRYALTSTPQPVIQANPRRIAIHCSVVTGSSTAGQIESQTFGPGGATTFNIPAGVNSLLKIQAWGAGGNGANGVNGVASGGGGGGGGYSEADNVDVSGVPALTFAIDSGGGAGNTSCTNPILSTSIVLANSGQNGAGATAGAGGSTSGAVGNVVFAGGVGGTGDNPVAGDGGGGGGAGGATGNGSAAVGQPGGTGNSPGGSGGKGATALLAAITGFAPGGGGGGGSQAQTAGAAGANGELIFTWVSPVTSGPWSLSQSNALTLGQATWNFMGTQSAFLCLHRDDYGDYICEQFWAIAGQSGVTVEITEILEECIAENIDGH